MALAFKMAKKADPYPNPQVGAVLVKEGKIIGIGTHQKAGMPHAEVEAVEDAIRKTNDHHIALGASLYVTLEPCSHTNKRTPPCTQYILKHKIAKVIYAMKDPNPLVHGAEELQQAGIEVVGPTEEKKGEALQKKHQPFVVIKMAMSADGKTATQTGDSKWISGSASRDYVHRLRTQFDAVMVGAGTVKADNPGLTSYGKGRNPLPIIIDGQLSISPAAKVLNGKTLLVISKSVPDEKLKPFEGKAEIIVCGAKEVDLNSLVDLLRKRGMRKILIEGGSELNQKALQAGIVDQLQLFIAPKIIGGSGAKSVIGGEGIVQMNDALPLYLKSKKIIGDDLLLIYEIKK